MEDKHKIIILVLIVIILALLVGLAMVMPNTNKKDTNLTFKGESTISEGDSIKIQLTDDNGTALANQTVNITVTDKDKASSYYSVVTDANGTGELKFDKSAGEYNVTATYNGNENYAGSNANKKVTVEEVQTTSTSSSSSQSSSLPYSINNLPPSNDPNPETNRYQVDEYTVAQEYSDNYRSYVDLRTGERHGGFF